MNIKLLLIIFFPLQLIAQSVGKLRFEKVEGLSQSTVYSIMKDKQGFLWMATADGLNRFDGMEMKIYKPAIDNKKGSYSGRIIRSRLIEDESERIWFYTSAGLYAYNKKKNIFEFHYVSKEKGGQPWPIEPLWVDGVHLWGANSAWGIFDYNIQTKDWESYSASDSAENKINFFGNGVKDNKNNFWFIANKGILFFDKTKRKWQQLFTEKKFNGLGKSADTVYLEAGDQIFAYNITTFQLQKLEKEILPGYLSSAPTRFFTDKKNNVWAGDERGNIYCKRNQEGIFKWKGNINDENAPGSSYPVYSLYVDDNDILWVGADVLGLLKAEINLPEFSVYPPTHENKKEISLFIHSIYEDEKDNIWLGTYRQGLLVINKNSAERIPIALPSPENPDDNSVTLIHRDSHHNLWIGRNDYLFVRENGSRDFKKVYLQAPEGLRTSGARPYSMAEYKDSLFFTSAWGVYLVRKNKTSYVAQLVTQSGYFYDIFIDNKKTFWFASENGIIRAKDLTTMSHDFFYLFHGIGIKSFLHDSAHHLLWISTTSGLIAYHLPSGKFKNFTEADGLGNSYVYGALQKDSILWISTNNGLSKAVVSFSKDVLPDVKFTNFTVSDGLPADEFNSGAFHKGSSGDFYFGSINGVVWFQPQKVASNFYLPRIVMTNILVNEGKPDSIISPEYISHLSLPYYKNSLLFYFRGIELTHPDKVNYAYKLDGWDNDWVYSGTLNEVRYNKLPPGNYFFKVKAANNAGSWNENAYTVSVVIYPPFWKTRWFYSLGILVVVVTIIFVTRYISQNKLKERIRQLEKQQAIEAERSRISKDMHDEIGSGLTRIALMTELMHTQKQLDEKTKEDVNEIAGSTRQLVETMSEIIWAMNPKNDKLSNLLSYLREQTRHYFEPFNMNYRIIFPDTIPDLQLSNEQRRNLFLVSKEALNNALKHSGATTIEFSASAMNGRFQFSVTDNGKGINLSGIRTGASGLKNMQQRMKDIKGGIEWMQPEDGGTKVNFWIPI